MNLNYDQFNGDALIFKYNLDEYGNPISIKVDKEENLELCKNIANLCKKSNIDVVFTSYR